MRRIRRPRHATGELVHSQADIAAKTKDGIYEVHYDRRGQHVVVKATDGRRYHVIASDGLRLVELPTNHQTRHASGVNWPQKGSKWAKLDEQRSVRSEGHTRSRFLIGNDPIGDRDWLLPALVHHPHTKTALWSNPDSLLIEEPTLLRSEVFKLTRYGLDGTVLWTFNPELPSHSTNWSSYIAVGDTLVYPSKDGVLIGVDPATGRERYRTRR